MHLQQLPTKLVAYGWVIMKKEKISKSKGNVIYPDILVKRYGLDAVRYYLTKIVSIDRDGQFSPEDFIESINSNLSNDFGNLLNRTIAMVNKYCGGYVPAYKGDTNKIDL